jgi:tartrate dehydrogenase/decarboxylase / D-malate dehydrogenase
MMLRHLGLPEAAHSIENAIAEVLAEGNVRTPDVGGAASTKELGGAIASRVGRER